MSNDSKNANTSNICKTCDCGNVFITSKDDPGIACFECMKTLLLTEEQQ